MFTVKHEGLEYGINGIKSASKSSAISDIPQLDMVVVKGSNNPAYQHLNEESVVVVDGQEWRIKVEVERTHYKNLTALHTFIDLEQMPYLDYYETREVKPSVVLGEIFDGTGYTFDLRDADINISLKDFGRFSKWEAFKVVIKQLETEFIIKPGNVVAIGKFLTVDKGHQFRYGHNLKTISKTTDSTDVVTHVVVVYGENLDQQTTFISDSASNYSRAYYGEVITDDRISTIDEARELAREKFKNINLSYELDVSTYENIYELGELVYTIYEPLDDLELVTRIRSMKEDWDGEEFNLNTITVGNYVFQTAEDIIHDQLQDEKDRTDDEIDKVKKELRVGFQDTKDYVDAELGEVSSEFTSLVTLTAQSLRTEFEEETEMINGEITTINNSVSGLIQTANSIQSTVNAQQLVISGVETRLTSAESNISQNAYDITLKVSETDYTGNAIVGKINLSSTTATIQAEHINLVGAVTVLSDITGNLGNISAGNIDIQDDIRVGQNIWLEGVGDRGLYFDRFGTTGSLTSDGTTCFLSSDNVQIDGNQAIFVYSPEVTIETQNDNQISGFVGTGHDNMHLAYSAGANRLYVRIGGSTSAYNVGSIGLD